MVGFGFYLGFPDGRPRGAAGGASEQRLAGNVRVYPEFEAAGLQLTHSLGGVLDLDPKVEGALDPMRLLYGRLDIDPDFSANLQQIMALRGRVDVNPDLAAEIEEVVYVTLGGEIDVDPDFSADMAEPIAVYEGPELIGSTTFSLNPGSSATVTYSGDWNDGDLLVLISESPRTTPLNPVPSGFTLLFQSDIGTIGGADACRTIVYGGYKSGTSVGVTAAASNDHSVYLMLCFRGTHATLASALKFITASSTNGSTARQIAGTLETSGDNRAIVVYAGHGADSFADDATFSNLGGLQDVEPKVHSGTTGGNGGGISAVAGYVIADTTITPNPQVTYPTSRPIIIGMLEICPP